ncbi:hypothetical protein ADMFC3_06300 [Geovibrio sp. ADMFC3]|jgi:hypothetical protein
MNVDNILIFLSGFMIGGFACSRLEGYLVSRRFPDESGREEYEAYMRKLSFAGVFFAVLVGVVSYSIYPHTFVYGLCGGYALFAAKIGM